MASVKVSREWQVSLVEETWFEGKVADKPVEVHGKVFRCLSGKWNGAYAAQFHVHFQAGHLMSYGGGPRPEKLDWAPSREEALEKALAALESRTDISER